MRTLTAASEPDEPNCWPDPYRFEPMVPGGPATFSSMDMTIEWPQSWPLPTATTVQASVVLTTTT